MRGWLLDTNVVSELRRPRPDRNVLAFVGAQSLERLFISVVTLAEIRFGIDRLPDPAVRASFSAWLSQRVRPMFEQRVLPLSEDVVFRWRVAVAEVHGGRIRAENLHPHGARFVVSLPREIAPTIDTEAQETSP